jgi:hypothetical protein
MSFSPIVTKGHVSNKFSSNNSKQQTKTHPFEVDSSWIGEVAGVLGELNVHGRLSGPGNSSIIGLLRFRCSLPSVTFKIDLFSLIVAMLGTCECVGMALLLGEQL